ncbi:MAG: hypothetical protein H6Q42_2830 [Deltaproteobacteria bacterium]|nr:hypothetical protein [Deltaproteobacteria bacterium]
MDRNDRRLDRLNHKMAMGILPNRVIRHEKNGNNLLFLKNLSMRKFRGEHNFYQIFYLTFKPIGL